VYWEQAGELYTTVTEKANWLENQRKEAAVKADVAKQIDQLNKIVDQLNSTISSASIGEVMPHEASEGNTIQLTTPGADLQPYRRSLKVLVGGSAANITNVDSKAVHFKVPAQPSECMSVPCSVRLQVGNMIIAPAGEPPTLTYKQTGS
jgi:hypothetical protein